MRNPLTRLALLVAGVCLLSPSWAVAQWATDSTTNIPVCVASGTQVLPAACSDGLNGAVIAWQDSRNGASAIYAQRLDSNGHAVWPKDGLLLANSRNYAQTSPLVATDNNGGAYIAWMDTRHGTTIYAQHVRGDGTLAYPDTGLAVAAGANGRANPAMCDDGMGGTFIAWEDSRAAKSTDRPDIYMNKLMDGQAKFGSSGSLIDGSKSTQRFPAICNDGAGGCFIAWHSGTSLPIAVWAMHVDANGNQLWGSPGFKIYQKICGDCSYANTSHVTVNRDGQQLMLAWEITSANSADSQNIMACRIRNAAPNDTTLVWGQSVDVTGEMIYDQTNPQIFSDDSSVSQGSIYRGVLVPYENQKPGSADDRDVSMTRVLGNGAMTMPGNYSAYDFATLPHGQVGFKVVKIDTTLLAVWNDARFGGFSGPDTCIYAQELDKFGYKHFPSYRSTTKWGKAICSGTWTAKQVTIAPRAHGVIIAWCDYRAGNTDPNIYAQVIMTDGSMTNGYFPGDITPPTSTILDRTGGDGSLCNTRCADVIAMDSGKSQGGLKAILPTSMNNMQLNVPAFSVGAPSVPFSVCVTDSMRDGSATISMRDTASNTSSLSFTYCTIPDTLAPSLTWDTVANWLNLHIRDDRPWDRGLLSVTATDTINVMFTPPLDMVKPGEGSFNTLASQVDTSKASSFHLVLRDTVGNTSQEFVFSKGAFAAVASIPVEHLSISVFPNPTNGIATVKLDGAAGADVSVFDVLGNAVDRFRVEQSYEWQTGTLPRGTYILRASTGVAVVSKRIVRE